MWVHVMWWNLEFRKKFTSPFDVRMFVEVAFYLAFIYLSCINLRIVFIAFL